MTWLLNLVARLSPLYRDAASALAAHVVQENVMDRALVHARAMLEKETAARRDVEKELALRERELLSLQKTVAMVCYLQKDGDEHMHLWTPELAQRPDMNPVPLINALVYVMEQRLAVVQKTREEMDEERRKQLTLGATVGRYTADIEARVERAVVAALHHAMKPVLPAGGGDRLTKYIALRADAESHDSGRFDEQSEGH